MNIYNIFPTPICNFNIERKIKTSELNYILSLDKRKNLGNFNSIDTYILENENLKDIQKFIQNSLDEYFSTIFNPAQSQCAKLYITQSWANYNQHEQYHQRHNHQNSFVSGVFYPKIDDEISEIQFYSPTSHLIEIIPEEYNMWNSNTMNCYIKTGDLIIFPSWIQHMVPPNIRNDTRISIAFNTFVSGIFGKKEKLTELKLI